jgi:ubiquinone/menaquinone biosynthesis C-methylase UbiE
MPYRSTALGVRGTADGHATGAFELRTRWRVNVLPTLDGDVLDVGAGDGGSLAHLPDSARVALLEPHRRSANRLERQVAHRRGSRVLHAGAERIPLAAAAVDAAVCCVVLCSVADQDQALAEIHRVLRPGGRLVLLEHVAAARGTWVRRAQRLVAPVSRLLDRGCDPARDTEAALDRSAFTVEELCRVDSVGPWGLRIPHLLAVLVRPGRTRR